MPGSAQTLFSPRDVRLDLHAFVEASAGTGKTHLIEKLFLRILREELAPAEGILILTYTEKAAGELRERIRTALEREGAGEIFVRALENFDSVSIQTVHGFCADLLNEYGAELGVFGGNLISDAEIIPPALVRILRHEWPGKFGTELSRILQGGGYPGYHGGLMGSSWEDTVIRTAAAVTVPEERILPLLPPGQELGELLAGTDEKKGAYLQRDAVVQIRRILAGVKEERGAFTYQDMLDRVDENLPESGGNAFLTALQHRYRYAIVDEFQDTDPVQWRIFRKIFLSTGGGRILLVGDPKQAIYGFRGADLETYFRAKDEIMAAGGMSYRLGVNYRSAPAVIDALNPVFSSHHWFGGGVGAMTWTSVESAAPEDRRRSSASDSSGRAALNICSVDAGRASQAKRAFYQFAAAEIRRLVDGTLIQIKEKDGAVRPLHWGDACFLVRSGAEVDLLESVLRRAGVPFSYYKKPRLYESTEALEISIMLAAVMDPGRESRFRAALLTTFFRLTFSDAVDSPSFDSDHWTRGLVERLGDFAARREWARFFSVMLYESRLFNVPVSADMDRHVGAVRQILEELEDFAVNSRSDLAGLVDHLNELLRGSRLSMDDVDIYRRETEDQRVQIMTMHASKGLEFPLVFAGGGLTQAAWHQGSHLRYAVPDAEGHKHQVINLNKSKEFSEAHAAEVDAENKRLYYVAFTRAVLKLYVPIFSGKKNQWCGPLQTFAREALATAHPAGSGVVHRLILDGSGRVRDQDAPVPQVESTMSVNPPVAAGEPPMNPARLDIAPPNLEGRSRELYSYSGLVKHAPARFEEEEDEVREVAAPGNETAEEKDILDTMRGREFGIFLHEVLEKIEFGEFQEPPVGLFQTNEALVKGLLFTHGYDPAVYADVVHALLKRILCTPLFGVNGLRLCDLSVDERTPEMEFYMKAPGEIRAGSYPGITLDPEKGTIWGFIDLVFRYADKVYLLDWKTDFLPAYDEAALQEAVAGSGYDVQAAIYSQAVRRWIADRPDKVEFGGALYLFVRGMDPEKPGSGVLLIEAGS